MIGSSPLSGSLTVTLSLFFKQGVKINIVGNVSSILSNREVGQFLPLKCQLERPHLHRNVDVWSKR